MRHQYPEGDINGAPPPTPLWKTTFESHDAVPSAPHNINGSNQPAASGSTGQIVSSGTPQNANISISFQSLPRSAQSARVSITASGPGSGSTFRSPLTQGQAPATNCQKALKVRSRGKVVHSSTVVPENSHDMSIAEWLRTVDSTRTIGPPSAYSGVSRQPWYGVSGFTNDSKYFEVCRPAPDKTNGQWLVARVVSHVVCETPGGGAEIQYMVSFSGLMTEIKREQTYSLAEIRVPEYRFDANIRPSKATVRRNSTVFAFLQVTYGSESHFVWVPSVYLAFEKPHGYRIRVIAGHFKDQVISKVLEVKPYSEEIAKELLNSGQEVERLEKLSGRRSNVHIEYGNLCLPKVTK
ncbi:hypothetical protein BYT27DRAFT_6752651 [Phlegmacium glaucopus]|nr:hypothetical protein BYT27DRAFT_6752651 [Phlegmacium glaucopus]